jgi:hypothetical protein
MRTSVRLVLSCCLAFGICPTLVRAAADILAPDNLMAWCIVPFDSRKRGPEERAQMLVQLGIKHYAYDYRDEHIPTFDAEVEAMKRYGIGFDVWWLPANLGPTTQKIFETIRRHQIKPQLWVFLTDPAPKSTKQADKVKAAVTILRPVAEVARELGCRLALYNHLSWFGEPENQLEIIQQLGMPNVGIVYNFHHGHGHIDRFPQLFKQMQPHLLALNLNGMVKNGDKTGKKILTLGEGDQELAMLRVVLDSGWRGPVGILNHRSMDSEVALRDNLAGLAKLRRQLLSAEKGDK